MTTVLITGHLGFVGQHLAAYLDYLGVDTVVGYDQINGDDIRDYERLRAVIAATNPDEIYHLAAQAYVAESLTDPGRALDVNTIGTLNLLNAVRNTGCRAKILLAGTSEEYGYENQPGPIVTEVSPTLPTTPYGVSKLAATSMGMVFHRQHGLHVVATRAFNHSGPGKSAVYADAAFAKRVAAAVRFGTPVHHGNLKAVRNYTDVRDIVRAYTQVIHATPGIYNVCSDQNVTMQHILDTLIRVSGAGGLDVREDGDLYRLSGSAIWHNPQNVKIHAAVGWRPEIPLEQTLTDLYADWENRL